MAAALIFLIIIFQFVTKLITNDTNRQLRQLSRSIGSYIHQLFQFMSFNSNYKPYPFGEWPEGELDRVEKTTGRETDPAGDADGD